MQSFIFNAVDQPRYVIGDKLDSNSVSARPHQVNSEANKSYESKMTMNQRNQYISIM